MWDVIIWDGENAIDFIPSSWRCCSSLNAENNKTRYKYPTGMAPPKIRELINTCSDLENNFKYSSAKCIIERIATLSEAEACCTKTNSLSKIEVVEIDDDDAENNNTKRIYVANEQNEEEIPPKRYARLETAPQEDFYSPPASNSNKENFERLFREIAEMKSEIKDLKCSVQRIISFYSDGRHATVSVNPPNCFAVNTLINFLPCRTHEDICKVEEMITSPEIRKQLVQLLYLVGGDTVHRTIYLMMAKLLGNEVALHYSGQGKKKKLPFSSLNMSKLIFEATRMRHSNSQDDEIRRYISVYLASSKSRLAPAKRQELVLDSE